MCHDIGVGGSDIRLVRLKNEPKVTGGIDTSKVMKSIFAPGLNSQEMRLERVVVCLSILSDRGIEVSRCMIDLSPRCGRLVAMSQYLESPS